MTEKIKRSQVIKKRIVKSILWVILTPILLLFIVIGLIQIPRVQNYIVDEAAQYLTENTGYRSEINHVNIRWFNSVTLDGLDVYDHGNRPMISVKEAVISFKLKDLVSSSSIVISEAWLDGASVNLRTEDEDGMNINDWLTKITELSAPKQPSTAPSVFSIDKITLLNSQFSLSDSRRDSISEGFDYNHFTLTNLRADITQLQSRRDTFEMNVQYLTAEDVASKLKIDRLETFFQTSQTGMGFSELDLVMGKTHIQDSVIFRFEHPSAMSDFETDVDISANLINTQLHSDELSYFVPEFKQYDQLITIDGYFKGRVNAFESDEFAISFGTNSQLNGRLDIEGLPNIEETIFDIDLDDSFLKGTDIRQFMDAQTFSILNKFGLIKLDGQYDGFVNDFVADGEFNTALGYIQSNTQITVPENDLPSYSGGLTLKNFDVGTLTEDSTFQKVNLQGNVKGKGFTLETANFELDAKIEKIGILGYNYVDITTDGKFAQSFFSGEITVDDPNLIFQARGSVDIRDNKRVFNIDGQLTRADLKEIKLTEEEMFVATDFNLDFQGLKLDSLVGDFYLTDTYFKYRTEDLLVDSIFFSSKKNAASRSLDFNSDFFDVNLDGNFEFSTLLNEIININEQYKLVFSSRTSELDGFLKTNGRSQQQFDITYSADLPNISPIIQLFDSAIYVGKNATFAGRFNNTNSEDFKLNAVVDTLNYANITFLNNEIDINATSLRDPTKVLALGYLYSEKQIYANTSETDKLTVEAVWDGKRIELRQNVEQTSSGNYAEIGAGIDFFENRTELRFQESNITVLDQTWNITENNVVIFGPEEITIENLDIYNENQSITLDGKLSVAQDTSQTLKAVFEDVEVENINTLTQKSYSGKINGSISAQNLLKNPLLFGDIQIKQFKIDEFLVGDIQGELSWNDFNKKFDLDLTVNRLDKEIIAVNGDFFPSQANNQLDLDLTLNEANINIAEPYIEDYFTEIAGNVSGKLTISGTLSDPVIRGNGTVKNGGIKINYLNTFYDFDGNLRFDKNLISLSDLDFRDLNGSPAQFGGEIRHNSFKDLTLDLTGQITNFQVLQTTLEQSDQFYGDAYATGTVNLRGAASNLTIDANVTTRPNTRIYIPITDNTDVGQVDYITFINRKDTAQTSQSTGDEVDKIKIEGLKLDLNINVTPDAYTEIIIDAKTGDIIRGRGNGQLRLQIDTQGDFQMNGGLDITEGAYNFSLYNIITKEFTLEQPSRITWFGDPYAGIMDITASYSQTTSLDPILQRSGLLSSDGSGTSGRRFPTKVLLKLNGPLLSPEINFDIDFSEITTQDPQLQAGINAFKNRIASDEQELNRQVLNVIVLNSFTASDNLNIGGKTAYQNVSQLLSNQLSQLVAQLDENLEIDFDLADISDNAFNTFQLRLSYTFLNGRLRVTREGGLTNQINSTDGVVQGQVVDVNSIAGDWTAEYLLTADGRYKVKVYSRSNYDLARSLLAGNSTNQTTGASITQSISFNSLGEFFSGVNRKRRERKKEEKANKEAEEKKATEGNSN